MTVELILSNLAASRTEEDDLRSLLRDYCCLQCRPYRDSGSRADRRYLELIDRHNIEILITDRSLLDKMRERIVVDIIFTHSNESF